MNKLFVKVLLLLSLISSVAYSASEETVVFSKKLDAKYDEKVYRKVTILFTEARLKLQKKYKKYLNFEYVEDSIEDKKEIIKFLKEKKARYYVSLDIKEKKCKDGICKAKYIIKVTDSKKKKNITLNLKSKINNNEFVEISSALIKSNTKKLVKFLKKKINVFVRL